MALTDEKKQSLIQALKFLLFSISAGVIQIIADTIMLEVFHFKPWLAHLIALILSVIWNYCYA